MKIAGIFDMDMTLVRTYLGPEFYRHLNRVGLLAERYLAEMERAFQGYLRGEIGQLECYRAFQRAYVNGFAGNRVEAVEAEASSFLSQNDFLFPYSRGLVGLFRDRERVIVSSSPREIVAPIAQELGATDFLASSIKTLDGVYVPEGETVVVAPYTKKEWTLTLAAQRGIDLSRSFGFGDSDHDTHLEVVGHPVVLNPSDSFRRHAISKGWTVLTVEDGVVESVGRLLEAAV